MNVTICSSVPFFFTTLSSPALHITLGSCLQPLLTSPRPCTFLQLPRPAILKPSTRCPQTFPSFPNYLTAPTINTPVLTSLICSAVTWTVSPTSSPAPQTLISHTLFILAQMLRSLSDCRPCYVPGFGSCVPCVVGYCVFSSFKRLRPSLTCLKVIWSIADHLPNSIHISP